MNIYLVKIETSYDYRKFPWFKKSRGSFYLKANTQVIVADSPEEAERKYRDIRSNKIVEWPLIMKLTAEGFLPIICKEPNIKNRFLIQELNKKQPLGEYIQYMTPYDIRILCLSKEHEYQN